MEPIAIIGVGCRFPQAKNPEAFWHLLKSGQDAITEVPKTRWDINHLYDPDPKTPGKMNTRWGGFLEDVDLFDAEFFRIAPNEVEHIDPQQRLFLEVAWEALENAAISPTSLAGSQTGVFIGLCTIDYHRLLYKNHSCINPYSGTGTTPCITANRLSYLLDLRGPSMAIDTACSSSLVTVHLACQSLRAQESDLCIAGGVNLILSPDSTISSSQTGMLSTEGRCQTFDANADGYVRGEGCGAIILKRLRDAIRDGDHVLAVIKGSAVNQNGMSNSLTAPNGLAQQAVIRQALKNANVQPDQISYVDAHAVGTALGDAIEFKALKTVLMEQRQPDRPCWIGSVKTNIGHLEAAGGISALIKIVLSLQHEEIPPHLNFKEINPWISLENTPFAIPTESQPWLRGQEPRIACVGAFGFGGTNAHVVIAEAPLSSAQILPEANSHNDRPCHVVTLSAKSDLALQEIARRYEEFISDRPEINLADLGFTTNTGRAHFEYRFCAVSRSLSEFQEQLTSFLTQQKVAGLLSAKVREKRQPKIVFVFPDVNQEYLNLGSQLYQTYPPFQQEIDRCALIVQPWLKHSLTEILYGVTTGNNPQEKAAALFAVEYALAKVWQSWGIKPRAVLGYGIGKYVAVCLAEALSLEDALKLAIFGESANQVKELVFSQPKIPCFATEAGQLNSFSLNSYQDWLNPQSHSENWDEAIKSLKELKYQIFLGMSLQLTDEPNCLPSLSSEQDDWQTILQSLGKLYIRGVNIDWVQFDAEYYRVPLQLPTYPFQRKRYWFKSAEASYQEISNKVTDFQHQEEQKKSA